jgi:hypothetical protein
MEYEMFDSEHSFTADRSRFTLQVKSCLSLPGQALHEWNSQYSEDTPQLRTYYCLVSYETTAQIHKLNTVFLLLLGVWVCGTTASNRPSVHPPEHTWIKCSIGGITMTEDNWRTGRKTRPSATLSTTNRTGITQGTNWGPPSWEAGNSAVTGGDRNLGQKMSCTLHSKMQ